MAFAVATFSGCGGPELLSVSGRVVFTDGEPVKTGRIEYNAVEGPWRAVGEIDASGRFALATSDGTNALPAGEYQVVVVQVVIAEDLSAAQHDHGRPVPRKYADYRTSGLNATVSKENAASQSIALEPK
jgi:hypothetical protein